MNVTFLEKKYFEHMAELLLSFRINSYDSWLAKAVRFLGCALPWRYILFTTT